MRRTRIAILVIGSLLIAALAAWMLGTGGGLPAATATTPPGGLTHRETLVGMLALGVIALAVYGFDVRDWF